MAIINLDPGVRLHEIQEPGAIEVNGNLSGVLVGVFDRGDLKPVVNTSSKQILSRYTSEGKPNPRLGSAIYSALVGVGAAPIYIRRITRNARSAYLVVKTDGTAVRKTTPVLDIELYDFEDDEVMIIGARNPGEWGQKVSITTSENVNYKSNFGINLTITDDAYPKAPIEVLVSTNSHLKDGSGRATFIEAVVNDRNPYVMVELNPTFENTHIPIIEDKLYLEDGSNGDAVTIGDYILAYEEFDNAEIYDTQILMTGGIADHDFDIAKNNIARNRVNCYNLAGFPFELETSYDPVTALRDYRSAGALTDSFSGLYADHIKIYDKWNDVHLFVANDGIKFYRMAKTFEQNEYWYPSAGWVNGKLLITDVSRIFNSKERGLLYEYQINTIRFHHKKGFALWGNKTAQVMDGPLGREHVRMLQVWLEPKIINYLDDFVFALNDTVTRTLVKVGINSILSYVQSRRGIEEFKIICDKSNNDDAGSATTLTVDIYCRITGVAEYIIFNNHLTPHGVDLSVYVGQNN